MIRSDGELSLVQSCIEKFLPFGKDNFSKRVCIWLNNIALYGIVILLALNKTKKNNRTLHPHPPFIFSENILPERIYILIGEGFSFELHSLLTARRILTFEVSN
jgi:hypothetical protein